MNMDAAELLTRLTRQVLMIRLSMQHHDQLTVTQLAELVEHYELMANGATTVHARAHPYVQEWEEALHYVDQTLRALAYLGLQVTDAQTLMKIEQPYRRVTDFVWHETVPLAWLTYPTFFEVVCPWCGETIGSVHNQARPPSRSPQRGELDAMSAFATVHAPCCPRSGTEPPPKAVIKLKGFHL
jgi:hypothetical protein